MVSIRANLKSQAGHTRQSMQLSASTGIWMPETGITAANLQKQASRCAPSLYVLDFDAYTESNLTGADWLWVFVHGTDVFLAAVQAKRQSKHNTYDIRYQPPSPKGSPPKPLQVDTLLKFSNFWQAAPLYCLYNGKVPGNAGSVINYTATSSSGPEWGCSVIDGNLIGYYVTLPSPYPNKTSDLLPLSLPWHELFCSSPTSNAVKRAVKWISTLQKTPWPSGRAPQIFGTTQPIPSQLVLILKEVAKGNMPGANKLLRDTPLPRRMVIVGASTNRILKTLVPRAVRARLKMPDQPQPTTRP